MANDGLICWNCGSLTGITGRVMRSDQCEKCLADMRACHGCCHYDPSRRYQCKESIEFLVKDKTKNNLCDFFQKRDATKRAGGISSQVDRKSDKKKNFDDLFKD